MGKRSALVAVILLIAGCVVGWLLVTGGGESERTPPPVEPGAVDHPGAGRLRHERASGESTTDTERTPPFATGVVVDESDAPVANARILVRGHTEIAGDVVEADIADAGEPACVTGADGRFSLQDEPADVATLAVLASGFEIAEIRDPDRDVRIVLHRCEPFRTRVVDSAGRPIADVRVVLIGSVDWDAGGRRTSVTAHTGTDGAVEFRSIPADARVGSVLVAGYALRDLFNNPFGVELSEEYVLARTAVIVDVRSADDGAPVADAGGAVVATIGSVVGALTPGDERYAPATPPGRLIWRPARGCTGIPLTVRVFAPRHVTRSLAVTLTGGTEPPHLEVALSRGDEPASISGRVIDGEGAVVTVRARPRYPDGFHLQADDSRLPAVVATTLGPDGAFAFAGLPPATYCITLQHADRPFTSLDVMAPVTGLELRFPAQATLQVTLTDAAGDPLAGEWVHVQTADEKGSWEMQTDTEGRAVFDPVPAVALDVLPLRNAGVLAAVGFDHPAMPHARVEPTPGETARVTLVRPSGAKVNVIVREDTGAPVRDATVRVKMYRGLGAFLRKERQRLEEQEWFTDAEGRVVLELPPSGGSLTAISRERSATAKYSTTDAAPIEIVLATQFGVVRGRVVERRTGRPVGGRPISVRSAGHRSSGTTTDSDGRFVVGRVPAGRVKVTIDGRQSADGTFERSSPYPHASIELDLDGDEDRTVEFAIPRVRGDEALAASETLKVRVIGPDDEPAEGATVVAYGRFGDVRVMLADGPVDADGRVSLQLAEADGYYVVGFAGGRSTEVEATEIQDEELEIRLTAE